MRQQAPLFKQACSPSCVPLVTSCSVMAEGGTSCSPTIVLSEAHSRSGFVPPTFQHPIQLGRNVRASASPFLLVEESEHFIHVGLGFSRQSGHIDPRPEIFGLVDPQFCLLIRACRKGTTQLVVSKPGNTTPVFTLKLVQLVRLEVTNAGPTVLGTHPFTTWTFANGCPQWAILPRNLDLGLDDGADEGVHTIPALFPGLFGHLEKPSRGLAAFVCIAPWRGRVFVCEGNKNLLVDGVHGGHGQCDFPLPSTNPVDTAYVPSK